MDDVLLLCGDHWAVFTGHPQRSCETLRTIQQRCFFHRGDLRYKRYPLSLSRSLGRLICSTSQYRRTPVTVNMGTSFADRAAPNRRARGHVLALRLHHRGGGGGPWLTRVGRGGSSASPPSDPAGQVDLATRPGDACPTARRSAGVALRVSPCVTRPRARASSWVRGAPPKRVQLSLPARTMCGLP